MLRLLVSNRFEELLESLLVELASEDLAPFAAPSVIVPSTAVRRRIELACADREGVCANLGFSFLAQWLWQCLGRLVDVAEQSPFSAAVLVWRVFEILGDRRFTDAQPRLASYLRGADEVMRLELAQRSAQLLEHYVTYRPQWLERWASGQGAGIPGLTVTQRADEDWQAALWRRLTAELGVPRRHPAVDFFARVEQLGDDALVRAGLPPSASVFCLPTLPPLHLELLRGLARCMEIRFYLLNPCREYWFDIVDRGRLSTLAARQRDDHHEVGNTLLAAWGRQRQTQLEQVFATDDGVAEDESRYVAAGGNDLLSRVHDAILDLYDLAPGSVTLAADDRSVEAHVCHSLQRELEVLHDQLLAQFAEAEPPTPGQILVALPDLESAAPLIDAVFGTAPAGRRIPYVITGLAPTRSNPLVALLDQLLSLCGSRFPASAVFGLMQQPPVAAKFGLHSDDLDQIHDWIAAAGIRWGLDGNSRREHDLPFDEAHSFADGLHRLFLAYALGDSDAARQTVIAGRLAAANPEGQQALTLGRLWRFYSELRALHEEWSQALDASRWQRSLSAVLSRFAAVGTDLVDEWRAVQATINALHANMLRAGSRSRLPLAVVRKALNDLLDDRGAGAAPGGGVTFSSLVGLRGLPYRVVCLLGMNDGVFPSSEAPCEFDLMALAPQPADRQRRLDERNLFLDLVLAARQRLYLSYSGRNRRDNRVVPPSVLVAELLDYVAVACAAEPGNPDSVDAVRRRLTVEHPLQPFARDYFLADGDARRRSFNREYALALQGAEKTPLPAATVPVDAGDDETTEETIDEAALPFFTGPLDPPCAEWRQVSGEQLQRFYRNPCRTLLAGRLNLSLASDDEELSDEEQFLPDYPERRSLAHRLLPVLLAGGDPSTLRTLAMAGNEFPRGSLGERLLDLELAHLRRFADDLRSRLVTPALPEVPIALATEIAGETWQLTTTLVDLRADGLLRYRYDELRATDYLAGWIEHLLLCAQPPEGVCLQTRWLARAGGYQLQACSPAVARALIDELLRFYRQGLSEPLPFYPKSAWDYLDGGLIAARRRWRNDRQPAHGECADPAYRLALRGVADPLDERFADCARRIFGPLREHLRELS